VALQVPQVGSHPTCFLSEVSLPAPLPEQVIIDRTLGIDGHPDVAPRPPIQWIEVTVTTPRLADRPADDCSMIRMRVGDQEAVGVRISGPATLRGLIPQMSEPGARVIVEESRCGVDPKVLAVVECRAMLPQPV
jgi:hypothetical protein